MPEGAADLARAVRMYLDREIGFDEFELLFSELFLNRIPEGALSDAHLDAFGEINEKLMSTSAAPSAEARSFGWIDLEQFRQWLASRAQGE